MKIKQRQQFASKATGQIVKVTKVIRNTWNPERDDCYVTDVKDGQLVKGTRRVVYADSLRRKYSPV